MIARVRVCVCVRETSPIGTSRISVAVRRGEAYYFTSIRRRQRLFNYLFFR